jgi:hypothetical protein
VDVVDLAVIIEALCAMNMKILPTGKSVVSYQHFQWTPVVIGENPVPTDTMMEWT